MQPSSPRFLQILVLVATILSVGRTVPAQCAPQLLPGEPLGAPHGRGSVMQVWDPAGPAPEELVLGGSLWVGSVAGASVIAYDGSVWRALGTPPSGTCTALGLFQGRLIAAVSRSTTASDIAAWDGTAWQVLGGMRGVAHAMTLFQGRLVLGGTFSHVNGLPASNVIQWDGSTWSALGVAAGGVGGTVLALAEYFGSLYVGGDITHASGVPVANLAVWDGSAWSAGATFDRTVRAFAVRYASATLNSHLFVGGDFTIGAGIPMDRVGRFNLLSGWAQVGTALPSGSCAALYVRGSGLSSYELTAAMSGGQSPVVRLQGATWLPLGTGASGSGAALALYAFRSVVSFTSGLPIVRWLESGEWLPPSGPGIDGSVRTVHATATDVLIGGSFSSISGVRMNGIARGRVGAWQALGSGVGGGGVSSVTTLANGDVIAAGDFTSAGGTAANGIARFDGTGWSALGSGIIGGVRAMATLPNGDLVVAGSITGAGGQPVNRIARWNGSTWLPLGSGMDDEVWCLAVAPDGLLWAGGLFTTAGGVAANRLARWNGTAWLPMPSSPNGAVAALAVLPNGDVLVGGYFAAVGSLPTNYIARWSAGGWTAIPGFSQMLFSRVQALVALPTGEAIVGGYGAALTAFFARYDGTSVVALTPSTFILESGALAPTGEVFMSSGGLTHQLVSPCPAVARHYGTGCTGSGGANALTASGLPWIGTTFRSEASGMPASGLALGILGLGAAQLPINGFLRQGVPGCDLLATLDVAQPITPRAGVATSVLPIPALPGLIGQVVHQQIVAFELDSGLQLVAVTSSNGLRLTLGAF